jgi:hypothetical protein
MSAKFTKSARFRESLHRDATHCGTNAARIVQDFIPGQNTSSTRKPIAGFDPDSPTESFGISPDGTGITLCEREQSSSLVLAENPPLD